MIRVSSSRLKAKMGVYMRAVREGKQILVTDRDQPVARLVPVGTERGREPLAAVRPRDPAAPPLGKVRVRGIRPRETDTTAMLLEDRDRR